MNDQTSKLQRSRFFSPGVCFGLGFFVVALISFILFAHPFLAITQRVDADVLVVEGWIPGYMMPPSAKEFREGKYAFFMVSGLENDPNDNQAESEPVQTAARLRKLGIPSQALIICPAPFARWMRTSKTAVAVRAKIDALGIKPKGINVITAGPHARETWVAYQHAFGRDMPVGIISIPKSNYPADRWWLSSQGLIWVPKDFIAWLKEVVFGAHSR